VRLGGDRALADDVMQQVWIAASQSCTRDEVQDWEAWLRGIARNLCRQHWRRSACRPPGVPLADPAVAAQVAELLDRAPLPQELLARREVQDQILLALTLLPAADQALIIRHHFRGESQARIAEDTQTTVRAIEGRLYRARRALRSCLTQLEAGI
jgi:RNA polymerase sigma-70 factor (ECF subfamily)